MSDVSRAERVAERLVSEPRRFHDHPQRHVDEVFIGMFAPMAWHREPWYAEGSLVGIFCTCELECGWKTKRTGRGDACGYVPVFAKRAELEAAGIEIGEFLPYTPRPSALQALLDRVRGVAA